MTTATKAPKAETTEAPRAEKARSHEKYQRLIDFCKTLPPTPTAVAHPCDQSSLQGAVEAARMGLIAPILCGPRARIEAVAKEFKIDISGLPIVDAPFSHASAEKAVGLVREGKAEALMKGSLHTDELMGAVVQRDAGLRTARRISHCFVMDVPSYPETLIVTDAAVNISPTLEDKVDIIQNAIDLAHALQFKEVRVAILSAMETVNPKVPSTVEAGALCKMADRGQITGAILDGPLALDNAISLESVKIKKIDSPVAGRANVLVVPDLEAGNMLAKSLSFLAGADAAGIVLGARVPIILTSRADSVLTRLASCAVAVLVANARRQAANAVACRARCDRRSQCGVVEPQVLALHRARRRARADGARADRRALHRAALRRQGPRRQDPRREVVGRRRQTRPRRRARSSRGVRPRGARRTEAHRRRPSRRSWRARVQPTRARRCEGALRAGKIRTARALTPAAQSRTDPGIAGASS
jgi:phosphate acetyltransferase